MKRVLENDFLKVTIDDHGAELVSIYDKEKDREVIWQGDPRFWGRHAPVLFPNVGKHYGNHYRIGDREYANYRFHRSYLVKLCCFLSLEQSYSFICSCHFDSCDF